MNHWSPPPSPLRIEYPDDFWTQFQPDPARIETLGLLYGRAEGNIVRLTKKEDEGRDQVGIYFLRSRGEIFLTEANIAAFEDYGACLALVIVGSKAGFFVRDADGLLQSIRSYEEFPVPRLRRRPSKAALAAGIVVLAAAPLSALAYLHSAPQTGLSVAQKGNLLSISWRPGCTGELRIVEGRSQSTMPVTADQSSTNYILQGTGEVKVTLTLADRPKLFRRALF